MRVAVLANVPVWILPGLEGLRHNRHYATWLESLVPQFVNFPDLQIHWVTMCKEVEKDLEHHAFGQTFHILSRRGLGRQMVTCYAGEILRIRRKLKDIQPDVLHAWGSEDVYGLAASLSGVQERLFTLQGCLTEYVRLLGGSALFRLQAFYEKPMIRRFKKATAESPAAVRLLKEINPRLDVELVDYGVNLDFFEASWKPALQPEILFLGSLTKRKGIHDLIEVAKSPEMSGVLFKIAGDGELRSELKGKSPKNVEWLGNCDRPTVIHHLSTAWALYIPTYSDTGPTVVKEARVVGLPIVTTTGAGASCYVKDADCGFVTEPGDLKAQLNALKTLTSSKESALSYGRKGFEKHQEQLHPGTTANRFAAVYEAIHRDKV